MVWLYILQSRKTGRFYVGATERIDTREQEHNTGQTKSTRGRGPWMLVYSEEHPDRSSAMKRENQIKGWKSHRSIQALIDTER